MEDNISSYCSKYHFRSRGTVNSDGTDYLGDRNSYLSGSYRLQKSRISWKLVCFYSTHGASYAVGGIESIFTSLTVVGIVYLIVSIVIRMTGPGWINRLLPPVVVGPMIIIIGLSLASTAVSQIGLDLKVVPVTHIIVALISFLATALIAIRSKGILKIIPFLIGILAGYIASAALGLVDFSSVLAANAVEIPKFYLPFINYDLNFATTLPIIPNAVVSIVEHIGDHKVLSEIIGHDLIEDPGLQKTLLGDGIATLIAALIGGPANTTYSQNSSVIGMTGIASAYVIFLAAVIAILFAFSSHLTSLFSAIPQPVLGGISLLLYGFISVNGIKILIQNQVDFNNTRNVVVTGAMLVLGLGGAALSVAYGNLSVSISGMSLAAIAGVILNLCFGEKNL